MGRAGCGDEHMRGEAVMRHHGRRLAGVGKYHCPQALVDVLACNTRGKRSWTLLTR